MILRLPNEQLLRIATVARLLSVGEEAVRGFIEEGTLLAVNVGRDSQHPRWRIVTRHLDAEGKPLKSTSTTFKRPPYTLEEFVARRVNLPIQSTFNF